MGAGKVVGEVGCGVGSLEEGVCEEQSVRGTGQGDWGLEGCGVGGGRSVKEKESDWL